jgi:integrase
MPRRGENVYKRKDGRWEGRILKPDGKYCYAYARTYKEIKEKMKQHYENVKTGGEKARELAQSAAGLFESWLKSGISELVKPSTYESYDRCMQKHVIPFFMKNGHDRLTAQSSEQFVKSIKDNGALSDAYKRKILSIFKTALRKISKGSPEYSSVLETVTLTKTVNTAVEVFTIKEQRLVEKATLDSPDKRAFGILLCFYSGIRLGELCALKWADIDLEAGTLSVLRTATRTKNFQPGENKTVLLVGMPKSRKSVRKIPLPAFLVELAARNKSRDITDECFILSGSDRPMDPRTYQKIYKKILKKAGVQDRKFHAIRHTFATRALELGVDIKTISEILGHSNVTITLNIYAHSLMDQKKIAIDKLNEMHISYMNIDSFAVAVPVAAS